MWDSREGSLRRWRGWWLGAPDDADTAWPTLHRVLGAAIGHDVTPTLAVLLAAAIQLSPAGRTSHTPLVAGSLFSLGLALPLLARRRRPVIVFAVLAAVALVQWVSDVRLVADLALLVAMYAVFERRAARVNWLAVLVLELGALMAVLRWEHSGHADTFVLLSTATTAAAVSGIAVRNRRMAEQARMAGLEQELLAEHQRTMLQLGNDRARIAREMHDILAHGLAVMVRLSDAALAKLPAKPEDAKAAVRAIGTAGRAGLDDLRRILAVLRLDSEGAAERSPQPGLADLPGLFARIEATGLQVRTCGLVVGTALDPGIQLVVYRVVQEALTNVLKHAEHPTIATVSLRREAMRAILAITDDGQSSARASMPGQGLLGLTERVKAYGGTLSAGPADGGGWSLRAVVDIGAKSL